MRGSKTNRCGPSAWPSGGAATPCDGQRVKDVLAAEKPGDRHQWTKELILDRQLIDLQLFDTIEIGNHRGHDVARHRRGDQRDTRRTGESLGQFPARARPAIQMASCHAYPIVDLGKIAIVGSTWKRRVPSDSTIRPRDTRTARRFQP